uniref:2-C-methyl-D-erythritol 4-phosphate cytidylyltransferase-like protein n=1 Tax=Lygus hesperus TaxID=30085 RepID=A0A0A9Y6P3_LYGHE
MCDKMDFNVGVVLPSAGSGLRMNSADSVPKQYIKILKKPLFLYAVEAFSSLDYVKKIVLVADNVEKMTGCLLEFGLAENNRILVTRGCTTRHRSIKKGLQELEKFRDEFDLKVVVVHDAVRPFVPKTLMDELVRESLSSGAAGPTKSLVSTVVKPSPQGSLEDSLQRTLYANSETPQSFRFDILMSAYSKISEEDLDFGTECLQLVMKYCGVNAKLIPTEHDLSKVTYNRDVYTVESVLKEKMSDVCIISERETEVLKLLADTLIGRVASLKTLVGSLSENSKENGKTYNNVVLFHHKEIQQDRHLLDFANLIDLERRGLIIHIIDHASIDGLQSMSVYNLHRNSRKMAHHYEKLSKGVVVIHCVSSNELQRIASMVLSLISDDPQTFSGQTLFL